MISAIYKPAQMNPISDLGKPRESRILPPDWPPGAAGESELPPVESQHLLNKHIKPGFG